jgi:heptaprenyl diphosphate synthase
MCHKGEIAVNSDTNTFTLCPAFPAEEICTRMREVLLTDNHAIDEIITYMTANSGKMIRPRMVFLAASMAPYDPVMVRDAAVAVELIHMASLVHDDVIDHAMIRRGQESINKRWGNHTSVLTGDYLFATAFNLINQHGMQDILENVTTTIRTMCVGEIKQMSMAGNLHITEEEYLEKNYGKTACLFASSCKVGAMAASLPDDSVYNLEQFGLCLGYAYQIIDDLLDFMSDSEKLGKPVGTDLLEGNITLPVILGLRSTKYGIWLSTLLESGLLTEGLMPQVIAALIDSQAIASSLQTARQFIARGLAHLATLPSGPAIKELEYLAAYLLESYYQKLSQDKEPILQGAAQ